MSLISAGSISLDSTFKGIRSPDDASDSNSARNIRDTSSSTERAHPMPIAGTLGKEITKSRDASNRSDTSNTMAPATEIAIVGTCNNRE